MEDLLLMRGNPFYLTEHICINNPTLGQIADFGEEQYWGMVTELCCTSYDYRLMLDEAGIDYLDIDDYTMFRTICVGLQPNETQILIPNIDFSKLIAAQHKDTERIVLADPDSGEVILDEFIYQLMVDHIRNIHCMERNFEVPGNPQARDVFMWEAREARENAKRKKFKSTLGPMVSAMCNQEGFKYNYNTVWDLNIYAFMDAVRRIQKIKLADHFEAGMYSGMMDTSKMGKGQIRKITNWMDEL